MTLREQLHRSVDELDNRALTLVYEQVRILRRPDANNDNARSALSLEEILELTKDSPGNWSDDIIADREERI